MDDVAIVNCTVLNARAVRRGRLIAVASVEIDIEVVLVLEGVRVFRLRLEGDRREMEGVGPPCYRDPDGPWREAVRLPAEAEKVLGDEVLRYVRTHGLSAQGQ